MISTPLHRRRNCRAFTLIELLVVIGIIAILAALLIAVISSARARAERATCMNNLRQIDVGVRMYSDDSNDKAPRTPGWAHHPYDVYKELMKNYVGLRGKSSEKDKIFACPADAYYFDYWLNYDYPSPRQGYVPRSVYSESRSDFSSYLFNAGNLMTDRYGKSIGRPGIAGLSISSIKHPARTTMVFEVPALIPFSWHQPKHPLYVLSTKNCPNAIFNNAMNMVSFADGHVSYVRIYWKETPKLWMVSGDYDPPADYDYQWSGN